jgi:hypothetical protein
MALASQKKVVIPKSHGGQEIKNMFIFSKICVLCIKVSIVIVCVLQLVVVH